MGCCGGTTKKTVRQIKDIVTGYANLARNKKYEFTDDRVRDCQECDEQTWLTKTEYDAWLLRNGIKVLTNFTQLEKLPKLPKHEQSNKRRRLYCRLCKCFIPAKARVKDKICPLGKWESDTN